jgi:hypothetical protein
VQCSITVIVAGATNQTQEIRTAVKLPDEPLPDLREQVSKLEPLKHVMSL